MINSIFKLVCKESSYEFNLLGSYSALRDNGCGIAAYKIKIINKIGFGCGVDKNERIAKNSLSTMKGEWDKNNGVF